MTTRFRAPKSANFHRTCHRCCHRSTSTLKAIAVIGACLLALSGTALHAQGGYGRPDDRPDYSRADRDRRDQDRDQDDNGNRGRNENGLNAGGNWTEYRTKDPMTAAKRVRFELPAENAREGDDRA